MQIQAGVGRSGTHDSAKAGREAAQAAREKLQDAAPAFALVFGTAGHDQDALLAGVSAALGPVPLSGCSAEGVITQHGSDECSHAVAVMAIAAEDVQFRTYLVSAFAENAAQAAQSLSQQVGEAASSGGLLLVFPDGVQGNCREFIETLEAGLPADVIIAGGTAGDLLKFERTYQYHDGQVHTGAVAAVLITGAFDIELTVSHGCDLIGLPQTVTKAADGFVHEIDGSPSWEVFKSYLPDDAEGLEAVHVAHLLLAEHISDGGTSDFGDFTVRVPVKLNQDDGSLYFAAGLTTGTQVQLALRNVDKVCERALGSAQTLIDRRRGERPLLLWQLDCAGRGRLLFDEGPTAPLIEPMQQIVGKDVPWLGIHTYGEIAPIAGRTFFHNYTGVLCALYPRRSEGDG